MVRIKRNGNQFSEALRSNSSYSSRRPTEQLKSFEREYRKRNRNPVIELS